MHIRCKHGWENHPQVSACLSGLSKCSPFSWKFLQNSVRTDASTNLEHRRGDPITFLRSNIIKFQQTSDSCFWHPPTSLELQNQQANTLKDPTHYSIIYYWTTTATFTQAAQEEECWCSNARTQALRVDSLFCTQRQQGDGWLSPTQFSSKQDIIRTSASHI